MVNGAFNPVTNAGNFRLQRGDPRLKLLDRQRVEVLAGKLCDQIASAAGKIVGFHGSGSLT